VKIPFERSEKEIVFILQFHFPIYTFIEDLVFISEFVANPFERSEKN